MRLGIDMLGVQSPESRGRGIGRYARSLVGAMLRRDDGHEYFLYSHRDLPTDAFPESANAEVRRFPAGTPAHRAVDDLARQNPDGLDALLLSAPFELHDGYSPPAKPLNGLVMASVVYDFVAFLSQERYLTYPPIASRFYRNLERLRGYDSLLAISESTRADVMNLLGLPGDRVVTIGSASDPKFFTPARPAFESVILTTLGITRPFVFGLSNMEERKNLSALLAAFGLLPERLRATHQLVLAGAFSPDDSARVRKLSGIGDSLVMTGPVSDRLLRTLYRRCAVFVFPSHFEGFGLPLLEAMHCGTVVIGGDNSSQIEVVGEAGLLADTNDPVDISAQIRRVLEDGRLASTLQERALTQAARFRWESTAEWTVAALARAVGRVRKPRPRLAVFSAWPPRKTPLADAALSLARSLCRTHDVDVYHESGYEPILGDESGGLRAVDQRLFGRNDSALVYENVIYLNGDSCNHRFMEPLMRERPGLVVAIGEEL